MSLDKDGLPLLNTQFGAVGSKVQLGHALGAVKANFKVPAAGYAAGSYVKLGGVYIPSGAIIKRAWYHVLTTFTSATDAATIAIGLNTTTDVFAAAAISTGTGLDAAAPKTCIQDNAIGNFLVLTAKRQLIITTAIETLTAGEMNVYLEYAFATS